MELEVHDYLHRKERDDTNAAYWYRLTSRSAFRNAFDEEWTQRLRLPGRCKTKLSSDSDG